MGLEMLGLVPKLAVFTEDFLSPDLQMADVEDSVPQNEPVMGILLLSLDIMTDAPLSLPECHI
jgi:hypothetical protein